MKEHRAKIIKETKARGVQFREMDTKPLAEACGPLRREYAEQLAGKEGLELLRIIEKLAE